jgi:AcrR family transcriptional regulator
MRPSSEQEQSADPQRPGAAEQAPGPQPLGAAVPAPQRPGADAADGQAALPAAPPRVARRRPAAGRKPALSVPVIVAAAIEVLDEAGFAGLSMRRVADRLGTGAASLYAHVSGREELLELVFDALVGQVKLEDPDPARWREQVHRLMRDFRDILASHTDAALAGLGRVPTAPQTLAAAEVLTGVLRAGGLSDRVIALGFDQLVLYVSASAYEAGLYRKADPSELERYFAGVHAFYASLPPGRYPVLTAVAPDMTGPDADERFEFGLNVLIAGLEAASAAEQASQQKDDRSKHA